MSLQYEQRGDLTALTRRDHVGPLRVQKAFYPEGGKVCHSVLLHPPAGIVGGDELAITVSVGDNAHALLTMPGAAKWYRSAAPWATQQLKFAVGNDAALEWLPQESIIFDGARAAMQTTIALAATASFIGWEVLCLGRRASGERFDSGALTMTTRFERGGRPLWLERGGLEGSSALLYSPAGLAGFSVSATLLATGKNLTPSLLAACRELVPTESGGLHGLTLLPDVLVARYLGHSSEAARAWFVALWGLLRPAMLAREAHMPRIWNT
ncbi:MAG TPA: urease accessory protein UreD [Burkholderiales bacterium]|nr:urease accessory protein UreD [Burkholderiales bacterium]